MLHATARKICSFKIRRVPCAPLSLCACECACACECVYYIIKAFRSIYKCNHATIDEGGEMVPEFRAGEDDAIEHLDSNSHSQAA